MKNNNLKPNNIIYVYEIVIYGILYNLLSVLLMDWIINIAYSILGMYLSFVTLSKSLVLLSIIGAFISFIVLFRIFISRDETIIKKYYYIFTVYSGVTGKLLIYSQYPVNPLVIAIIGFSVFMTSIIPKNNIQMIEKILLCVLPCSIIIGLIVLYNGRYIIIENLLSVLGLVLFSFNIIYRILLLKKIKEFYEHYRWALYIFLSKLFIVLMVLFYLSEYHK